MASLTEVRQGLMKVIEGGVQLPDGKTLYVYPNMVDKPNLPCVIIEPADAGFEVAMQRGSDVWYFNMFVMCSRADTPTGQAQLDLLVTGSGESSIRRAVYDRSDLGLEDTDATVTMLVGYGGTFKANDIPMVGAVLKVKVITKAT